MSVNDQLELPTWAGISKFRYDGCVKLGTRIFFGRNSCIKVGKTQYENLIKEYSGMTIKVGTSRTKPPQNSLGQWLQRNVTKTAIASYVSVILTEEGYAKKVEENKKYMIKFN